MKVAYEISKDLEKTFVGGRWHSLKYNYQILFTELTLEDRKLLGLPTTKMVDVEGTLTEVELTGKELTNEIISGSEHMPPLEDEVKIKALIKERIERRIKQMEDKLIVTPNEKVLVMEDDNFKKDLTNANDVT